MNIVGALVVIYVILEGNCDFEQILVILLKKLWRHAPVISLYHIAFAIIDIHTSFYMFPGHDISKYHIYRLFLHVSMHF